MSDGPRNSGKRPKTTFAPLQRPAPQVDSPAPSPPPTPTPTPTPPLALHILAAGVPPQAVGLQRDERGVVVGPQGLLLVQGVRRLNTLLAALSQVLDLAHGVALEAHAEGRFAIILTPPVTGVPLSQYYDTVQSCLAAARLSAPYAQLFVGAERFVPYTDPAAPHGYDVTGAAPSGTRIILRPAAAPLPLVAQPNALQTALLAMPLVAAPEPQPLTLSLLTDRRVAALIAGYVQRHGLAYAVRFLRWQRDTTTVEAALFDIVNAATLRPVPRFVIDFLRRLPHTTLLSDALEPADLEHEPSRRVLLAWGRRAAMHLPHIQELLPPNALLINADAPWGSALIAPPPPRTTMQHLTDVVLSGPTTTTLSNKEPARLQLRLELHRDNARNAPVHAILLATADLMRLRRSVRRLPATLFAHARIALGAGLALVIAEGEGELDGMPFGLPLVRAEPPTLLLPRGMRLLPALPQDLLIPVLGMQPDRITIITSDARYDIAAEAFQPLTTLLSLDAPAQSATFTMQPSTLPPLDLSDLEEPPQPVSPPAPPPPAAAPTSAKPATPRSWLERVLGHKETPAQRSGDFDAELHQRATELEQQGALELAAAFYTYLRDEQRAAACYQRLAEV